MKKKNEEYEKENKKYIYKEEVDDEKWGEKMKGERERGGKG